MKIDSYISKIIEETGLNKKEIQDLVTEKKEELKGLISDEGALFIIAKELGVDVKEEGREILRNIEINVIDIRESMKNIVLIGRIKHINRVFNFNRKDGSTGQVGSFILHDNTGDVRIVVWDDATVVFENPNFEINEIIKIVNGYAKKGKDGEIEIHLGKFSNLILTPDDVNYKQYPKITTKFIPISDINLTLQSVSIEGKIINKSPIREFIRKNGEKGKVNSLVLLDSTDTIRITFWNNETDKLKDFESGDTVSIANVNPRQSKLDPKLIDLYATSNTLIKKVDKDINLEGNVVDKIELLQNKQILATIRGIITSIDDLKKITLKSGEEVSLLGFILSDDTDWIRATLWREKADRYSNILKLGDGISLQNVMVKFNNFSRRNEISFINNSTIEVIDFHIEKAKMKEQVVKGEIKRDFTGDLSKISEISSSGIYEIKGFVAKDINKITVYEACSSCYKKKENCMCEEDRNFQNRLILGLIIDDESSTIRATFIGDIAERLIGENADVILTLKETPDYEKFLEKISTELVGRDLIIRGKAKFSDFSNSYEIVVYEFKEVDINEELEKVISEM